MKFISFHDVYIWFIDVILAKFLIKAGNLYMYLQNDRIPVILLPLWTWERHKQGQCSMQVFEIGGPISIGVIAQL